MNPYFEQTILNADPVELTVMIYQGAISCVREAREHLRRGRIAERSDSVTRAYVAVAELISSLRAEMAPEFAGRLRSLYIYIQQRLLDANIQQSDPPLEEVLGLLSTLAEGWFAVAAQLKVSGDPEAPPSGAIAWEDTSRLAIHA
ncbi:MAG TPA: flagellar export chaperone FliS [Bryobacteraceae bacterium]|nr:flagellar export chaperone FliS [Bryobacteraceae bacterium]